jgi:hypothetical protein
VPLLGRPGNLAIGSGNTVSVLLGKGGGTFQAVPNYNAGFNSANVIVRDFNGDGISDLAVVSGSISFTDLQGAVIIFLGKGDGSFQAAMSYPTGLGSFGAAVGDFNGDGILDLAVANLFSDTVSVLVGKGDGTFEAAVDYHVGVAPGWVSVGDFNGDGILDLAVANFGSSLVGAYPGTVSVLLGKGDGTFQAAQNYNGGTSPAFVAVGDFNRDGNLDLIVVDQGNPSGQGSSIAVWLGNGDGTFQTPVNHAAGAYPFSMAVADLNGDGIPDLAVANYLSEDVSVPWATATALSNKARATT